jgi:choline/ethanolamine kinase
MVAIENQTQVARAVEAAGPRIPKEARGLLHELAVAWVDAADRHALQVVPLKGAMTNEVYQVRWLIGLAAEPRKEREVRKVLERIYGDGVDLFFDREDEVRMLGSTIGSCWDRPSALLPINRWLFCRSTVGFITCNREHDRAN